MFLHYFKICIKKIIAVTPLLSMAFVCEHLSAQTIINTLYEDKPAVAISLESGTIGCSNVYMFFTEKKLATFEKQLKKKLRKFGRWSKAAADYNVRNYKKALSSDLEFDYLCFNYDSIMLTTNHLAIEPDFYINDNGDIYLRLEGCYDGVVENGFVTTTDGASFGVSGSRWFLSSTSSTTKFGKRVRVDFSLQIPKSDITQWIYKINNAYNTMKEEKEALKQEQKRNNKIFR